MKIFLERLDSELRKERSLDWWMLLSTAFSISLLVFRMAARQEPTYIFLAWNLLLAFIPYRLTIWLSAQTRNQVRPAKLLIVGITWLLFMPNSFYIMTDLFHLDNLNGHSWYDLTMILSFAWNGILFGIISIRKMEQLLYKFGGRMLSGLAVCLVMWLNAFGVYIGRFLRFNSWDVVVNPFGLFGSVSDILFDPIDHLYPWAMTGCFAVFMTILYYTIAQLGKAIRVT